MPADYLQIQKEKERAFRERDLEEALARLEDRDFVGLTSLQDIETKLAQTEEEVEKLRQESTQLLGESLLAMARPGSTFAALIDYVQAGNIQDIILSQELTDRHQSYVGLSKEDFTSLQIFLEKSNFDSIRDDLKLSSMESFTATTEWLLDSLHTFAHIMDQQGTMFAQLKSEINTLQKSEKKVLLELKNITDASLDNSPISTSKFQKTSAKLDDIQQKILQANTQKQLCLAQQSSSIDSLLQDIDQAVNQFTITTYQARTTAKQLDFIRQLDFDNVNNIKQSIAELLGDFDINLVSFLNTQADQRFDHHQISHDQKQAFLDLVDEQKAFQKQLESVYQNALARVKESVARVLATRHDFGRDVLDAYKEKGSLSW